MSGLSEAASGWDTLFGQVVGQNSNIVTTGLYEPFSIDKIRHEIFDHYNKPSNHQLITAEMINS